MSEILIGSNPDNAQLVGTFRSEATKQEKGKQVGSCCYREVGSDSEEW
jgi:hypothetical protein